LRGKTRLLCDFDSINYHYLPAQPSLPPPDQLCLTFFASRRGPAARWRCGVGGWLPRGALIRRSQSAPAPHSCQGPPPSPALSAAAGLGRARRGPAAATGLPNAPRTGRALPPATPLPLSLLWWARTVWREAGKKPQI